jgi:hypothetical protein
MPRLPDASQKHSLVGDPTLKTISSKKHHQVRVHTSAAAVVRRLVSCKMRSFFNTFVICLLISSSGAMRFCTACVPQLKSRCGHEAEVQQYPDTLAFRPCSTRKSLLKGSTVFHCCVTAVISQCWHGICHQARSQQQQQQLGDSYR